MLIRGSALIPLSCLLAACLAPGQRDPTRYPWDQPAPHPPLVARGAIPPLQVADARDNAAWARMSRHLPYCTAKDAKRVPRRFPARCVTPGPGANSPLGPAWVYRQVNEWLILHIKLRDLTPDELAALHPGPLPPGPSFCIMAIEPGTRSGITIGGNARVTNCSALPNAAPTLQPR